MTRQPSQPFRSFFSSIKLTIFIMVAIVLLSILGTLIPQQEGSLEFASRLSPSIARLLMKLQIFDIYHSMIFYFLMILLALNLVVCSLNRFPLSWRHFQASGFPTPEGLFAELPPERTMMVDMEKNTAGKKLEAFLKAKFRHIQKEEGVEETLLFAQRGRFCHLGVYVVHLSVLIIILGAVIGSLLGLDAYVNIGEGQTIQDVELKGGEGLQPLGFSVRCDKFIVEFYENGSPKTFRSDLSFIKDGRVVFQGPVLVNHPVSFEKMRFYQSSYGVSRDSRAFLTYTRGSTKSGELALTEGAILELPESKAMAKVLRIEENMMGTGPAVKLQVTGAHGVVTFWVFRNIEQIKRLNPGILTQLPLYNPGLFKPYEFALSRVEQKYYTGLQVVRDPGVPFVAVGGFLMIVGLMMVFWISHQRLWICVDQREDKTRIRVAGKSNRNQKGIEDEIKSLCAKITKP